MIETFFYLNSDKFLEGRENSVYELAEYRGELYIPDYRNDKLIVIDIASGRLAKTISVPTPHGIYIDSQGMIYVCSYKKNAVYVIDNDVVKEMQDDKFDHPVSLTQSGDKIYISNWGKGDLGSLLVSDKSFERVSYFGTRSNELKPHCVKSYSEHVYVLDRSKARVLVFDKNRKAKQYSLGNDFDPIALTVFDDKYIVPNYKDGLIYVFDEVFNRVKTIDAGDKYPMCVLVYKDNFFISEENGNRIQVLKVSEVLG